MYSLNLPSPAPADQSIPFRNPAEAGAWLGAQPQTQPQQMQAILQKAIAAIDASELPPAERLDILDLLRNAVLQVQSALESCYTRKPLPMAMAEGEVFFGARKLWRTLAVAYLRTVGQLPADQVARPLHRGAVALRLEQYAHFLAAYEVPKELLQLLYGVISTAEEFGVHEKPLGDPAFKQMGDSHIAGHVACAFLLQFIDPYCLSVAQLSVTHRAFSRWRELAAFQPVLEDDPKARAMPLASILGEDCVAQGRLRWLDVRPVLRKVRRRIEDLEAGETPEALQLGKELSAAACIRLLRQLKDTLRPGARPRGSQEGSVDLVFEADNIYALITGKEFLKGPSQTPSRPVDYQRMAVFGFDNMVTKVGADNRAQVPSETWQTAGDFAFRAAEPGRRLLAPCLVASRPEKGQVPRLGVLTALQTIPGGRLRGILQWYDAKVQAFTVSLPVSGGKAIPMPVFALEDKSGPALVLPASAAVRPESLLTLEGKDGQAPQVTLAQVQERGSDFVRYAVHSR